MITLNKLIFDTANVNEGANVGAYLRANDGTLLTYTDVGGKKALDVRVAEGINVEVDLSHVDDSVKIGDGTDFLEINTDGSINVKPSGAQTTNYDNAAINTTAALVIASALANRFRVLVQNVGPNKCYLGFDNAVTTADGMELANGASMEIDLGDGVDLYALTGTGTADLRFFELAS